MVNSFLKVNDNLDFKSYDIKNEIRSANFLLSKLGIHLYKISKNIKNQSKNANFAIICSKKSKFRNQNKISKTYFYDFLNISNITKNFTRFYACSKHLYQAQIKIIFASDNIEIPAETTNSVNNAAQITNHIYFYEKFWTPGNITNGWWFENFTYNSTQNNYLSAFVCLPQLEESINYWRESQIILFPQATIGSLNANIKMKTTYPIIGSYMNVLQTYYLSRLVGLLTYKNAVFYYNPNNNY